MMDCDEWPPEGYSGPFEYEFEEWEPYVPMLIIAVVLGLILEPIFSDAAAIIVDFAVPWFITFGLNQNIINLIFGALVLVLVVTGVVLVLWTRVIIPIHEEIHYWVADFLNLKPEHTVTVLMGIPNPSVTNWKKGISRGENIKSLSSPLVAIGVVTGILMIATSGLWSGIFGIFFWANTAASGGDIYHMIKIARKPPGTLFANFEEEDETEGKTEYVIPKEYC